MSRTKYQVGQRVQYRDGTCPGCVFEIEHVSISHSLVLGDRYYGTCVDGYKKGESFGAYTDDIILTPTASVPDKEEST